MIITIEIDDSEINTISGTMAAETVLHEFRRDPLWLIEAANVCTVSGYFGRASYEGMI